MEIKRRGSFGKLVGTKSAYEEFYGRAFLFFFCHRRGPLFFLLVVTLNVHTKSSTVCIYLSLLIVSILFIGLVFQRVVVERILVMIVVA